MDPQLKQPNLKLIKHWNGYKPGHVFTLMGRPQMKILVERGIGEYDDSETGQLDPQPDKRTKRRTGNARRSKKAVQNRPRN